MGRQDGRDRLISDAGADDAGATILHADLDAFFASVELLDRPDLRGKPVIVGRDSPRSVVTAATYEARRYGVNSAMPMAVALRRCPHAVVVEPHRDRYEHWSRVFFDICRTITPLVEEVGIDEGFLDVAGAGRAIGSPREAAELLRTRVREQTGLVASVGAAGTKFVAKLASGRSKPDGLLVIPVAETVAFLRPLPVDALWGIGGKLKERLTSRGIATVGELADTPMPVLRRVLGDAVAQKMHELSHGIDPRVVVTERDDVTIGRETTFEEDVSDGEQLRGVLLRLSDDVGSRLRRAGAQAKTVSIKVRFGDFRTITRARTLAQPTDVAHAIHEAAVALLDAEGPIPPVRLIGVRAELGAGQSGLWEDDSWREAEQAVDRARERFGRAAVTPARLLPGHRPD
ncbi:MAG TPA: DNA polymerase IV [Microbacteriaceae bacterium]|nr:DNA polymerase IV [Microbacteriaceae bacterium]